VGASVVGVDVGDNVVGVDVGVDVVGAGVGAGVGLGHIQPHWSDVEHLAVEGFELINQLLT